MSLATASERQPLFIALALVGLVAAVYSGALQCGFVNLDDPNHLLENPVVLRRDIAGAFTSTPAGLWIPLTWLSFIAEAALAGFAPWLFHLTNVLLHAANAVLVWRWLEVVGKCECRHPRMLHRVGDELCNALKEDWFHNVVMTTLKRVFIVLMYFL